jgi:hypothetical protein
MANLFDEANAPEGEPLTIVVGDFLQWKKTQLASDYPPATHSAEYVARVTQGGASEIKLAAVERDTYYLFTVPTATSEEFSPGFYHWQLEITETASGNRIVVERGEFEAVADLDVNGADPRSHAEIMLDKLEALIENRADGDLSSYSIAGRSITKMTAEELLNWRDYYRREVAVYRRRNAIARGKRGAATILMRFV